MDQDFYQAWFSGFQTAIDKLDTSSRETLLQECAKKCADTGIHQIYRDHYENVGRDRDSFYARLSEISGVSGEIIVSGQEYYVVFPACTCDLHTTAGVNSPNLCECSRQSIIYIAKSIWGDVPLTVEMIESILSGAKECRFKITFG